MSMRLSRSVVGEAEARAVSRVITEDGYLGMGNEVRLFEEEVAQYLGVKPSQVITVNTGTAALHLAVDAVAAQCQKAIQLLILIGLFHVLDLVHIVIADDFHHLERLTFGTQNRTAACENAGEIIR